MSDTPVAIPDWAEAMNQLHSRVSTLEAENAELRKQLTHCENCGGSFHDDGLGSKCNCVLSAENARLRDTVAFQKRVIVEGEDIIERLREAVRWVVENQLADEWQTNPKWMAEELLRRAGLEEEMP